MRITSRMAIAGVVLLTAVPVSAAGPEPAARVESDAPIVEHVPTPRLPAGTAVVIRARILSPLGNEVMPTLHVRVPGVGSYATVGMKPVPRVADVYVAEIPGELTDTVVEYYLEAFDSEGNGPGRSGTPERPHRVGLGIDPPPRPSADGTSRAERRTEPGAIATSPAPADPSVPDDVFLPAPAPASGSLLPWVLGGTGAVAVVAGAVVAGLAIAAAGSDHVTLANGRPTHTLTQQQADTLNAEATAGTFLLGAGAVLLGGSAAAFVFHW